MATAEMHKQVLQELLALPRCLAVGCGLRSRYLDECHLCSHCSQKSMVQMIPHSEMSREELSAEMYEIKESLRYAESAFERSMLREREFLCGRYVQELNKR